MGVPVHQLLGHAIDHIGKIEAACFLLNLAVKHYLQQHIPQLFLEKGLVMGCRWPLWLHRSLR